MSAGSPSLSPLVVNAKFKNIKITLHGENHSDIDNSYYEKLAISSSAVILVEHSTDACEIKPEQEHLFRRHAKGSEWVFYTQKKANNPNVICFDTRSEHGYLNAFEEQTLRRIADNFHEAEQDSARALLNGIVRSIKVFSDHEDYFNVIPGYFKRSYNMIEGQLKALLSLLKYRKANGTKPVLGMPMNALLDGLASTLIDNIVKIGSVSTDISLVGALEIFTRCKPDEIHVFCGKNHAIRMVQMAQLKSVKISGSSAPPLESTDIELNGDPAIDREIQNLSL